MGGGTLSDDPEATAGCLDATGRREETNLGFSYGRIGLNREQWGITQPSRAALGIGWLDSRGRAGWRVSWRQELPPSGL